MGDWREESFFGYSLFGPCNVSDDGTLLVFTGLLIKGLNFSCFLDLVSRIFHTALCLTSSPTTLQRGDDLRVDDYRRK